MRCFWCPASFFIGFPCGSAGKESACNVGDLGLIPGLGRSPGEGKGFPLQYSGLENSMDCRVHGVAKSWTRLCEFHCLFLYLSIFNLRIIGGLVAKSCLTFCDSMDYSPPSSSLRGISQAKILEWVATSFSRRSS